MKHAVGRLETGHHIGAAQSTRVVATHKKRSTPARASRQGGLKNVFAQSRFVFDQGQDRDRARPVRSCRGLHRDQGRDTRIDFKYFWLAGTLWQEGVNPYGPAFSERAHQLFAGGSVPPQWAYPPHFRPIAELTALLPFAAAANLWRASCVLAVAGGVAILFAAIWPWVRMPAYGVVAFIAAALTFSSTAHSVAIGQSAPLIFLGYTLFVYGVLRESAWVMGAALVIIMIKPTYGLAPALFLLPQPRYWRSILCAAAVTILLTIWGLWGHDLRDTLADVGRAYTGYAGATVNSAPEMTGLRHLAYAVGLGETSQFLYAIAGGVLTLGVGWWAWRARPSIANRVRCLVLVMLITLTFVPMHTYDGFFVFLVIVPTLALSRAEFLTCLPLVLVTWRSNNVADLTGLKLPVIETFTGSSLESVTTLATLLAFCVIAYGKLGEARGASPYDHDTLANDHSAG